MSTVNCQLSTTQKRGDSLYILLSLSICQRSLRTSVRKWKPEGLDLSAGPVPVFPIIYIIYRDQRIAAPSQALLCEPRSTADPRRVVLRGVLLTCLTFACASVELRHFPPLQKGGVPAAPSGTATLLRLSPNHQFCLRPILAVTDFRHPRLSWLDGRCVQGPGTYSPRHG